MSTDPLPPPNRRRKRGGAGCIAVCAMVAIVALAIGWRVLPPTTQATIGPSIDGSSRRATFQLSRRWRRTVREVSRNQTEYHLAPPGALEAWLRAHLPGKRPAPSDEENLFAIASEQVTRRGIAFMDHGTPRVNMASAGGAITQVSSRDLTISGCKASYLIARSALPATAPSSGPVTIHLVLIAVPDSNSVCFFGGVCDAEHAPAMRDDVDTVVRTFRFQQDGAPKIR